MLITNIYFETKRNRWIHIVIQMEIKIKNNKMLFNLRDRIIIASLISNGVFVYFQANPKCYFLMF